jgi:hypothetical protein
MSRDKREPLPIQRGDGVSPNKDAAYKKAISKAKARGSRLRKPEDMEGVPRFEDIADAPKMRDIAEMAARGPTPEGLSDETVKGLSAMAEATAARAPEEESDEEEESREFTREELANLFGINTAVAAQVEQLVYPERNPDETSQLRKAIEARCDELDIGQYLMNGFVSQKVSIIEPGDNHPGLAVSFRTIPGSLEVYIDKVLSEEAAKIRTTRDEGKSVDVEMSTREYQRRSSEWALAAYIESYQGKTWPQHLDRQGNVNADAMEQRLQLVRTIPSHLFSLVGTNLQWFIERSVDKLNVAILGNG